jgi:LmbE family N-acetylglucosaminyl deacetylase
VSGANGTVLGVWAHPDDECYLSAGLMARAARQGERVVCVTATFGELGVTDESRWPADRLADIRRDELANSLAILGVDEHHWLGLPDGGCADADDEAVVRKIAAIIAATQPRIVVTFGPDGITDHPDHKAVGAWTTEAFDRAAPRGAELWYPAYEGDWEPAWGDELRALGVYPPGFPPVLDRTELVASALLDDELVDLKYAALSAQESQIEGLRSALGAGRYREFLRHESFMLAAVSIAPHPHAVIP